MKTIVSHLTPDIDSITSVWLVKRFLPGWQNAELKFVPAGSTLDDKSADSDIDIIHVDTGMGRFDHHQTSDYTSASQLVYQHLNKEGYLKQHQVKALEKIVTQITSFDHFREVYFPNPAADHYEFMLHKIIEGGLKSTLKEDYLILQAVFPFLDAVFNIFIKKNNAEEELKNGFIFQSHWGRSIVLESKNEETMKLALKSGYKLVAKKNPERGNVRIKTLPDKKLDLKPLYLKILKVDKKATWFLHASGNMLLNSSSKNPNFIPSSLTLNKLIEIIKSV
ncbi:chromate resistance protein [Candidatus Roizmanbacteria bacterium]|nr:chromate resistance protein [Candidatus Roizmanbacteria bacterium]